MSHEACGERLVKIGKVGLNDGLEFGEEGRGFRRMNIGCPRCVLEDGLERIKELVCKFCKGLFMQNKNECL